MRSQEASPEACAARCASLPDCIGSSFWSNGGCHLAGEGAALIDDEIVQSTKCFDGKHAIFPPQMFEFPTFELKLNARVKAAHQGADTALNGTLLVRGDI